MNFVQVLCAGGCNDNLSPALYWASHAFNILKVVALFIFVIACLFIVIKWAVQGSKKKNRIKGKELIKKLLGYLFTFIVVFLVCTGASIVINQLIDNSQWDNQYHCWCK